MSNNAAKRCWVIKIGSSLMTADGRGLDTDHIDDWVAQIAQLRAQGINIVLVSSGAVAEGMARLGWQERPDDLHRLQAAAAVGQMGLVQAWESRFAQHQLKTAQVLFTHEDVSHRRRYLNARNTLMTLLELGVIPVVNENDSVATDEIRLGDNDTLAALAANLIEADQLVILTDQDGLFDADPRSNPEAKLISDAQAGDPALMAMAAGGSGKLGRGGMRTKMTAAEWAANSGADTFIVNGRGENILLRLADSGAVGTRLRAGERKLGARKRWIAGQLQVRGKLILDAGACKVLSESGRSLLAVGVKTVEGRFNRGDVVACVSPEGMEIARGLVNFDAREAQRIAGQPSEKINEILGATSDKEMIHRDNLVLL